ncbi:MAG: preprotein translocase subunit SecE [Patescibacteria group bacterium]|nr:preprotein translocase subunit SecE [Patescibacteria group bacterium]MDE1944144.1 preprotein translocase subunit SecE [Patescibacteria group bacterium]MDE1944765.1 preprotein translocase subunit SecE [Patescibacteria group bacterium]MDE2058012.1 preprotein translocase subunit SecE [Patescibacteria group bacterium]
MTAITTYFKHVREEFAHIVWPSRETALAHTLVVILIALVIAAWVGALDYGLGAIVSGIVGG